MVYRLYRANRFLMTRIFIVLIIYSLIIGAIGIELLGVEINFDAQSFNPQLYDANVPNAGLTPQTGLLCDHYQSENCTWYLIGDLARDQNFPKFKGQISDIGNRTRSGNLLLLQDSTNKSSITDAQVHLDLQVFTNSSNVIPSNGINVTQGLCASLYDGRSCNTTTLADNFHFISNLNLYSDFNYVGFLGSKVLVRNYPSTNQPEILCSSQKGCPYYQSGNLTYTDSKTQTTINAYQAIIKPNTNVTEVGKLVDASRNGLVKVICVDENVNITNSCSNVGLYQIPDYFVFLDGNNNIRVGTLSLNFLESSKNVFIDKISSSGLTCTQINQYSPFSINGSIPITCLPATSEINNVGVTYTYIPSPLDQKAYPNSPKLAFNIDTTNIKIMIVLIQSSTQGKSTPAILLNILSKPYTIFQSLLKIELARQILEVVVVFFVVNIALAFLMIIFRFWKRIGGSLAPNVSMFQGKIGHALELTQFFQFGGSWYLEAQSVNDYNFKTTMGVVHELLRERWRDTIFFPTSLAASISILIFSVYANLFSIQALFALGGLLPLFLAFWLPPLWVIEDSGLKRSEWSDNGELLTIQKISDIIRDGFNKLVGFSAIFGIGTAGAAIARSIITGSSVSSTTAISGGIESILSLNFNFLASAILWTAAFLCIVTGVSLTGNVITALSYLNTDHLSNVKKMRTTLQKKEIFLGTTQQSMEHGSFDTSVYFDSKQGIDSALAQPGLSKRSQQMPLNQVIVPSMVSSEDELTRIIITNPSEVEVGVKPIEVSLKPVSQETLESGRKPQDEPSESVELQSHTQDQFQPQKQESTNDSESQEIEESNEKTNKSSESKNGKENSTDENQTNSSTNTDSQ